MNITPSAIQNNVTSEIERICALFNYQGFSYEVHQKPEGIAVYLFAPQTTLSKFDGSQGNSQAAKDTVRSLVYPFQELELLIQNRSIAGFAILPQKEFADDSVAHERTAFLGKLLRSASAGEISLD
jgi:hypothetical protein